MEENTQVIRKARVAIDYRDIYFYEEYVGDLLSDLGKDITIIHLQSGETMCLLKSFDSLYKLVESYKEEAKKESLWKMQ